METLSQGFVRSATRVAASALRAARTAARAVLRASSTCEKKAAACRRVLWVTITTLHTRPANPATLAVEHAQVHASILKSIW